MALLNFGRIRTVHALLFGKNPSNAAQNVVVGPAGQLHSADFLLEVNKGNVPGHSLVHKFGSNAAVGTTAEDIWEPGGILTFLTVADTLDVVSASVNDAAAGTHARTVTIYGLDATFTEISETVTLNGTTPVTTVASFIRVYRAKIATVGGLGAENRANSNDGAITIDDTTGSNTQAYIAAGDGQTSGTHYTIPLGYTGYMLGTSITMDTGKAINLELVVREDADDVTVPVSPHRHIHKWKGLDAPVSEKFIANHALTAKTDIWFDGSATSGTAAISIDYPILLVADGY